jgi:hypothetical protein
MIILANVLKDIEYMDELFFFKFINMKKVFK